MHFYNTDEALGHKTTIYNSFNSFDNLRLFLGKEFMALCTNMMSKNDGFRTNVKSGNKINNN